MTHRFLVHVGLAVSVACAAAMAVGAQAPQAVGTWRSGASVADGRSGAAAVPLADGRTLLVGGVLGDGAPTATVLAVDGATGVTTTAGIVSSPRVGHTATLLKDGRVLVAGGLVDGAASGVLELFDPATGTSVVAGALGEARAGHAAARLADGRVLLAGGTSPEGTVLATVEAWEPESGAVLPFAALTGPRTGASASTLLDGRVLVVGGHDGVQDLATAEIYDAETGFAPAATALSVPRHGHTAFVLPDNHGVLIAGGTSQGAAVAAVDLFLPPVYPDPYESASGEFAAAAELPAARTGGVAGAAGQGFAFVGGGATSGLFRFATLKTDKDDYAPGERAVITGSGWQPGEIVQLLFHETPAVHEDYVQSVIADEAGNIYLDQWAPEEHDLNVRFYLTAMDSVSRAQVTFTDGRLIQSVTLNGTSSVTVMPGASISTVVTVVTDGSGANNRWRSTGWRIAGAPGMVACVNHADHDGPGTYIESFTMTAPAATGTFNVYLSAHADDTCGGAGGGAGTLTLTGAVTVQGDTTPPDTSITAQPASATNLTSAVFSFAGTDNVTPLSVTFECKVDTDPFAACSSPATYAGLADGSHTFQVRAKDAAGNIDPTPASYSWTIDATAPDTTIGTAPPSLTNLTTASVSFTGSDAGGGAVTFECSLDGAAFGTCVSPASYTGLSEGTHTFRVRARDEAGNVDATPASAAWTVDLTAPTLSLPDDVTAEATGPSGASVTFAATAADAVDATPSVSCSPASGSTFAIATTTVTCTATDDAGNSRSGSFTVTVQDTTAPSIAAHDDLTVEATSAAGAVVNFVAPTTSDVVDGPGVATCAPASGTTVALGDTTVTCNATDAAGNAAVATTFVVHVVDTTAPVLTLPQPLTVEATGPTGAVATFSPTAADLVDAAPTVVCTPPSGGTFPLGATTVSCTATDDASNSATGTFVVTVADTTPPALSLPLDMTIEATGPAGAVATYTAAATDLVDGDRPVVCLPASGGTFTLGTHTVTCSASDTRGNSGQGSFTITVQDTTPPETSLVTQPDDPTNATSAAFTFTGADLVTAAANLTFDCALDGGAFAPCTSPQSYTNLAEGSHTFQVRATDTAGNVDPTPAAFTWIIDLTAPVVTVTVGTPDGSNGWFRTAPVTVTVTATDPSNVAGVTCTVDAGAVVVGGLSGTGTTSASGTFQATGDGQHAVACTATDGVGNSGASAGSSAAATVKIDTTAPAIALASRLPAANVHGWNNSDVTASWTCSDATSGPVAATVSQTATAEGAGQSLVGTCADQAGHSVQDSVGGINIDKTAPVVTPVTPPAGAPYVLNQAVTPSFTCGDGLSGFASAAGATTATGPNTTDCTGPATVDTATVGTRSYGPMSATDRAGNVSAPVTATYAVQFGFAGFFAPVENSVLNVVQAGRAIPMKWQLLDAAGAPVLNLATVRTLGFMQIACASEAVENPIAGDSDTTGASGLRIVGTEYQFNWQTEKRFANMCMEFRVTFTDDTTHSARFRFRK